MKQEEDRRDGCERRDKPRGKLWLLGLGAGGRDGREEGFGDANCETVSTGSLV